MDDGRTEYFDAGGKLVSIADGWVTGGGDSFFMDSALTHLRSLVTLTKESVGTALAGVKTPLRRVPDGYAAGAWFQVAVCDQVGTFSHDGTCLQWGHVIGVTYPPGITPAAGYNRALQGSLAGAPIHEVVRAVAREFCAAAARSLIVSTEINVALNTTKGQVTYIKGNVLEIARMSDNEVDAAFILPPPNHPHPFMPEAAVRALTATQE